MSQENEKRKYPRFKFLSKVLVFFVIPLGEDDKFEVRKRPMPGWINNISEGGLGIESDYSFDPNDQIQLIFEFVNGQSVGVVGKVAWQLDHHTGVQFLAADKAFLMSVRAFGMKGLI